ncbi:myocardin isoform X2 [Xenopus laevis]|uniref:Myocardin isoform X2 n=1 Tax=Xenopus laevis TaxID=8355 RepID=A0A8J0TF45_XENLA|nr:myocardin isoform X2 [Xenopus laevis]
MTLLASERSMLIRSKFRSVLQLRMQHRRSQEQMSERNLIPSPVVNKKPAPFPEQNGNLGQNKTEDFMRIKGQNKLHNKLHKVAASKMHFPEDALVESDELKEKKARLAEDLNERILHRPGPLELVKKNILPLATGIKEGMKDQIQSSPSSDAFSFEDDISSSSSSSTSSSPRFAPSPGLSVNLSPTSTNTVFQLDLPQIIEVNQPNVRKVTEAETLATSRPATHNPIQTSSVVPKVTVKSSDVGKIQRPKKPKDTKPKVKKLKYHQYIPPDQKAEKAPAAMDAAYSRLLQQQQIFLQLQILNQQQNPTFCVQTVHPLTTSIPPDQVISFTGAPPPSAPAINLSPSPGTAAVTAAPTSTVSSPLKPELLPANIDDLTVSELRQHLRKRGLPVSGTKPALLERLRPYQIPRAKTIPAPIQSAGLMTPIIELSAFPKPSACESLSPTLCTFRTVPSPPTGEVPQEPSETSCSMPESAEIPATVQDKDTPMQDIDDDHVLMEKQKVFCPPSCDLIGQDFELPMQITASPESPVQKPRSFEEELQEAIQKAQMALCESIEDILEEDEHLMCTDELMHIDPIPNMMEHHCSAALAPQHVNFSKPLYCCNDAPLAASVIASSGILEFPVSGHYDLLSGQDNLSVIFAPDQIEIPSSPEHQEHDSSPSPSSTSSSSAPFDPADWLEALTSGSTSNFGPGSPFGSSIFSTDIFDSPDLSINRMIDLMVEQW